jgi:hypothetical protein
MGPAASPRSRRADATHRAAKKRLVATRSARRMIRIVIEGVLVGAAVPGGKVGGEPRERQAIGSCSAVGRAGVGE